MGEMNMGERLVAFSPALASAPELGEDMKICRQLRGAVSCFSQVYSTFWPSFFPKSARLP